MADQLKACPCCGSPANVEYQNMPDAYSNHEAIECSNDLCAIRIPFWQDEDRAAAIAAWNTRAEQVGVPTVQAGDDYEKRASLRVQNQIQHLCQCVKDDAAAEGALSHRTELARDKLLTFIHQDCSAAPSQSVAVQAKALTDERKGWPHKQHFSITDETALTVQRVHDLFHLIQKGVIPLLRGDGVRNMTYADVKTRIDKLEPEFNAARCNIEDVLFQERTEAQPSAQADVAAVRDALIEQCAVIAEDEDHRVDARGLYDQLGDARGTSSNIAEAIRALKSAAPTAQPQADTGKGAK